MVLGQDAPSKPISLLYSVSFQAQFQMLTLVIKTLNDLDPKHLEDCLLSYRSSQMLRPVEGEFLVVHLLSDTWEMAALKRVLSKIALKSWNFLAMAVCPQFLLCSSCYTLKKHLFILVFDTLGILVCRTHILFFV